MQPAGAAVDPQDENEPPAPWWKCVVAALPDLFVALEFLMVLQRKPFFGATARGLTAAMQAEFLVIHSMAFLGLLALWKPADAKQRQTRAVVFWGLFGLYCLMALKAGPTQFMVFVGLTFVTYLGLFLNWRSPSAQLQLGARWFIGFALFLIALGIFDAPKNASEWGGRASVLRAGALYFFLLAVMELSGLYLRIIPRNSARLLAALRRKA